MVISADNRLMFKTVIDKNGFGIDFSKTTIHPDYETYIKQLEEEVEALREIVRMAHEYFNYFHNGEIIKFPKSPPQTPRWSI